jgi:two-component system, NarL family, invasion response regulator UvrY
VRILIGDDHEMVRKGIVQILRSAISLAVVDEARDGDEVLEKVARSDYNILLLDISMPGRGGLEVLRLVRDLKPGLRVLMLSMHPEEQYAVRALRGGASGYITKESAIEELIIAIRRIAGGRRYVSQTLAESLADELADDGAHPDLRSLSEREYQVLALIASGKKLKEIASALSLNPKTVTTYRTRILRKLHLKSTADVIRYASERGMESGT